MPRSFMRWYEGAEDVDAPVHADEVAALGHPLDLSPRQTGRDELRHRDAPPLPRGDRTNSTHDVVFVRHGSMVAAAAWRNHARLQRD
jgi:hypothetical protein